MDNFLTIAPLVVTLIGLIYFGSKKMKKFGVIYVIVYYTKWFIGVMVTITAFYLLMLSANYFKDNGYSVVFSLPIGAFVWFVPMHFISKFFIALEKKYKKEEEPV